MQKKFGTVLDEKILSQARAFCQKKHTTISHLLKEALTEYLRKESYPAAPFSTVEASFGVLTVPPKILQSVLEEDIYETE